MRLYVIWPNIINLGLQILSGILHWCLPGYLWIFICFYLLIWTTILGNHQVSLLPTYNIWFWILSLFLRHSLAINYLSKIYSNGNTIFCIRSRRARRFSVATIRHRLLLVVCMYHSSFAHIFFANKYYMDPVLFQRWLLIWASTMRCELGWLEHGVAFAASIAD